MNIDFRYSTILDMFELQVRQYADDTFTSQVVVSVYVKDADVLNMKLAIECAVEHAAIVRGGKLTQEDNNDEQQSVV